MFDKTSPSATPLTAASLPDPIRSNDRPASTVDKCLDTPHLCIEYLPPAELVPDQRNPRKHSRRQLRQIARSMQAFGCIVPVLVDANNKVLCGHGRVLAARMLGLNVIPVIRITSLTPEQARAFAIADNKLTENASWDDRLLGEIFLELSQLDVTFDLEVMGFATAVIDLKIAGLQIGDNQPDALDRFQFAADLPIITRPDDLWQLGRHRLYCGNALLSASFEILMQQLKAHVVFTDFPYNLRIAGHVSGNGAITHPEFAMASGEMSAAEFRQFLSTVIALLVFHSHPGSIHFQCIDWRHVEAMIAAGLEHYYELKNICVWVKDKGGMGSFYRSRHELVCVFKNGKAPHRNNIELGKHGRNRTNVWEYAGANTLSRQPGQENLLALHPTVKPVALIADALLDCTARGEIVLDCFMGSGSTLLAAERVGRIAYGIELDPQYVDTTIRRWQAYTGELAIHVASGKTFDSLTAEREASHVRE